MLFVPLHLDLLQKPFVGALRIATEARQRDHPLVEIRETHRQRVHVRMRFHEGQRDVLRVFPCHAHPLGHVMRIPLAMSCASPWPRHPGLHYFGISTTTSPRTIA